MGGAVNVTGNITKKAEYNFYIDVVLLIYILLPSMSSLRIWDYNVSTLEIGSFHRSAVSLSNLQIILNYTVKNYN